MPEPMIFGEGRISTGHFDSHPAFSPDGSTLYFLRSTPDFLFWTILVSQHESGSWSRPVIAPFSGQYSDADPFITPDGSRLFFISDRPSDDKSWRDTDIWVMDKTAKGWSEARRLEEPVNSDGNEWFPTVARNGTLYFGSDRPGGQGLTDLYRSRFEDGRYTEPENLGPVVNSPHHEYEPYVSPDERLLIFMATDIPGGYGGNDLYLSYFVNGELTVPQNLGPAINGPGGEYSPLISPDGRYFFWTSKRNRLGIERNEAMDFPELTRSLNGVKNGLGDIYQVDVSSLELRLSSE